MKRWLLSGVIGFLCFLCLVSAVKAEEAARLGTRVAIEPVEAVTLGESWALVAQLSVEASENPTAIPHQALVLFVDGAPLQQVWTNSRGTASFSTPSDLSTGVHEVTVEFGGAAAFEPSRATVDLVIRPATLEIQTEPPLPGVQFNLDNRLFSSDDDGVARIEVGRAGTYQLTVLSVPSATAAGDVRFSRWGDEVFTPSRSVTVPTRQPLEAGFHLTNRVSLSFLDPYGQVVDPARVSSVMLRDTHARTYVLDGTDLSQPYPLRVTTLIKTPTGLETTKVAFSVESVTVDGVNVVERGAQSFAFDPTRPPQIHVSLYPVHFSGRDALFGFPVGSGVRLVYQDGRSEDFAFGSDSEVTIAALAMGAYQARITGRLGVSRPIVADLSPNQRIQLSVISLLDIGVIATGLGGMACLGLATLLGYARSSDHGAHRNRVGGRQSAHEVWLAITRSARRWRGRAGQVGRRSNAESPKVLAAPAASVLTGVGRVPMSTGRAPHIAGDGEMEQMFERLQDTIAAGTGQLLEEFRAGFRTERGEVSPALRATADEQRAGLSRGPAAARAQVDRPQLAQHRQELTWPPSQPRHPHAHDPGPILLMPADASLGGLTATPRASARLVMEDRHRAGQVSPPPFGLHTEVDQAPMSTGRAPRIAGGGEMEQMFERLRDTIAAGTGQLLEELRIRGQR